MPSPLGTTVIHAGAPLEKATAAISSYSARQGAWAVRVHDVAPSLAAARVGDMLRRSGR